MIIILNFVCESKPTKLAVKLYDPGITLVIWKVPSSSDILPWFVFKYTEAANIGAPFSSTIFPLILVFTWAKEATEIKKVIKRNKIILSLLIMKFSWIIEATKIPFLRC